MYEIMSLVFGWIFLGWLGSLIGLHMDVKMDKRTNYTNRELELYLLLIIPLGPIALLISVLAYCTEAFKKVYRN